MQKALFLSASVLLFSGCSNLEAVQAISSSLTTASDTWRQAGDELHESCKRRFAINDSISNCRASQKSSEGLAAATDILRTYFSTLGAAANESNFSISEGLDELSGAVSGIEGVSPSQVKAVIGLAKSLSQLALNPRRKILVRELIDENGDDVRTIINSLLRNHVAGVLEDQLRTERAMLALFFDNKFEQSGLAAGVNPKQYCENRLPTDRPGLQFLLVNDFCMRDAKLQEREKALVAYRVSLERADDAMRDLQSNKTKLSRKALAQRLYAIGEELNTSVKDVRLAFD